MSSGVGELGRGGDLPFCQPYRQDAQVSLGLNEQGPSLGQCLSWLRGSFAQADRGRTCVRMNMRHQQHGKILIFDGNFSSLFVTYFALFRAFRVLFWLQLISFNDITSISWHFSLFSIFSDEKLEKSAR